MAKALKVEPKTPVNKALRTQKNKERRIAAQAAFQQRKATGIIVERGRKRAMFREEQRNNIVEIKAAIAVRA